MTRGMQIEVLAAPIVSYAMAHAGVPFLHRIVLGFPASGGPLEDVVIRAEVRDVHGVVITRPWQHHVDSVRRDLPLVLDNPAIRLHAEHMAGLEEETTAEVIVTVTLGAEPGRAPDEVVSHTPVRVLAARQWTLDPAAPVLSLELLASFVQPNHPAVGPVVAEAARLLARRTRSGSLQVQHVGRERVDAIVEAVFQAAHDLELHYAAPPASWGYGQKVRTPGDVFDGLIGTCLDTTLALASCLEHIGITPVLWVARGHAFLGYWRQEDAGLPDAATLQVATGANAVDLGLLGVVETTMVTLARRPPHDLFRRAAQAPLDTYFHGGSQDLLGVVDVGMARLMRVLPLPARRVRPDGVVELVEYRPSPQDEVSRPAAASAGIPDAGQATSGEPPRPSPPPRVRAWKNALLDLTLRNKLLNMNTAMTQAPLLTPSEQLGSLAGILQGGGTVSVRAVDDLAGALAGEGSRDAYALPGDVQRAMLVRRSTIYSTYPGDLHKSSMNRLRYRARTAIQETGANPLYVTLGRLDWQLGERRLSAPLLLAPVEIKGVVLPFRIASDESGAVTLNRSLMEKLRLEFGFTVEGLDELPLLPSGEGVDVDAVIRRVREAIAESGLPFRVESEARLAVIAFTGYLLWRDLDEHWETFLERPLVRHLALTPTDSYSAGVPPLLGDIDLDDVVASAPVPTDGSQAQAVAAARAGGTFVLEGPPGTGKSQTITGILADQLAQGRRVLFVAEKGAALDVVRSRLADVGLLPFALDLHDEGARPTEVRARLRAALAHRAQPDADGYRMAAQDVASSGKVLEAYAGRLHDRNPAGLSLYTARGQQLARGSGPRLTVPEVAVSAPGTSIDLARRAVAEAIPLLAALPKNDSPPWGFASTRPTPPDALWAALDEADRAVSAAGGALSSTPGVRDVAEAATTTAYLDVVSWLLSAHATDPAAAVEVRSERWRAARDELSHRTESLRQGAANLLTVFEPDVITVPVEPSRQSVREAASSFFLGRKGRLVAAGAPLLAHLRPGADVNPRQLPVLVEQVASLAAQNESLVGSWRSLPGCAGLHPAVNLLAGGFEHVWAITTAVERDAWLLEQLPAPLARSVVGARRTEPALAVAAHRALVDAVAALTAVFALTGTTGEDESRFAGDRGLLRTWKMTRPGRDTDRPRATALARWCEASEALKPLRGPLADARWRLLTGAVAPEDATQALARGLADASLSERWDAGGFAAFDASRQGHCVDRFVMGSDQLRTSLATALPAALLERRPFEPGALFGKVGALEREIGRTRGGLSVRRLVEQYGDVIGAITPCVLVSPDSMARFLPPGSMSFDLVVFDEASQITVADAIGALGRAQAAVIAGDSKQLPPSSFADIGAEDREDLESEFLVVPDEESILTEAVHAGVNRIWLSWHYRSQDESLIAFSNAAYYEDRLSSFPAYAGQVHDTGISFTRLQGAFQRSGDPGLLRTNPVEAAAIVAEVLRRWAARERSIGVVTFNIQQRSLIETMLWESGVEGVAESLAAKKDGLFVKNLENVQGDERDVILFSTGFSANKDGVLPLNFGPLNRSGGERRLNVAVTRARRRVMVFSSFEPEDLRVEETSSIGIRDLRRYLEVAKYGVERTLGNRVRVDGSGTAAPASRSAPAAGATGAAAATAAGAAAAHSSAAAASTRTGVDRHRDEIAARLVSAGLEVETGVGLSDFQVDLAVGPAGQGLVLAVLLDSPAWAARRTTSDRDALPTTVLQRVMGWPGVTRIWLPAWLEDPDAVVADLVQQAHAAATRPQSVGERVASTTWPAGGAPPQDARPQDARRRDAQPQDARRQDARRRDAQPQDAPTQDARLQHTRPWGEAAAAPPGIPGLSAVQADPVGLGAASAPVQEDYVPFVTDVLGGRSSLDALVAGRRMDRIQDLMRQIVAVEGPVSVRRLARLVTHAHGLVRVLDERVVQLARVVPAELCRDAEEGFVWPERRDPLQWKGFRRFDGPTKERPLEEVALREISNAMVYIAGNALGIGVDELFKETYRVFGGTRMTPPVRDRLSAALEVATRARRLAVAGGIAVSRD